MSRRGGLGFGAIALLALHLAGCGGGGGSGSSGGFDIGQVVVTIDWSINRGAAYSSVRAVIMAGCGSVGTGLASRPSQGATSTLTLSNVPAGTLTLCETACANADGTGASHPLGSGRVAVPAGSTAHIQLGADAGPGNVYVSSQGSDTNAGSQGAPVRTLQRGADLVRPGDTVLIADGNYAGGVSIDACGTADAPITFRAVNPGHVTVHGDQTSDTDAVAVTTTNWVTIEGITVVNGGRGIRVDRSNHVTVRNCRCLGNRLQGIFTNYSDDTLIEGNECANTREQHGIYVSNSGDRPIVRNNYCHDNARAGIQLNGDGKNLIPAFGTRGDGIIDGAEVVNNVISNCGTDTTNSAAGINLACVRNSTIAGNLIFHCYGSGIALFNDNQPDAVEWGSKNNKVMQNTVRFRPGEGRWCVSLKNGSTGNVVANNLLAGGQHGALEFDDRSPFTSDGNLLYSYAGVTIATNSQHAAYYTIDQWRTLSGQDLHSARADPGFNNPTAATDFQIGLASPAAGIGLPLTLSILDLDGTPFGVSGRWDAGCYVAR